MSKAAANIGALGYLKEDRILESITVRKTICRYCGDSGSPDKRDKCYGCGAPKIDREAFARNRRGS